jgi:peptidoglycan/LPS O-acetylase OafA/YrhL
MPSPTDTGGVPQQPYLSTGYGEDTYSPRRPHQSPYDPGFEPSAGGPGRRSPYDRSLAPEPESPYGPGPDATQPHSAFAPPSQPGAPGYDPGYDDTEYAAPGLDEDLYDQGYDRGYEPRYQPRLDDPLPAADEGRPPRPERDPGDLGPKLPHLPGLNGLRALGLLAVLVFAHDVDLLQGGFLGISTVFTLSGFLMATLALAEWSQTSHMLLGRFWDRRARNLLPPYLAVLAFVVILQVAVRVGSVPTFRGDVFAALGFVTNWRLAFPSAGFASSFTELSALTHLWPVSITAQVYLLFPLVFMMFMLVTGRQWRASGYAFAVLAALSFGAAWTLSGTTDERRIAYYGTHTRAGELLVGVVLAYLVLTPGFRTLLSKPLAMTVVRNGAAGALVVLVALWFLVPQDSTSLFKGITLLNALLTAWVILAVTMPGPAASILGFAPLRHLGEISFAAYLFHWPLYLLLDEERLGMSGPVLLAIRLGATLAAGAASYWAIQGPFRLQIVKVKPATVGAGLVGCAALLAAAVFVLPVNPPANISLDVDDGQGPGDLEVVAPVSGDPTARVLVVGDEAAGSLASGFVSWNEAPENDDQQFLVDTHVTEGCPLGGSGVRRDLGLEVEASLDCEAWRPRLPRMLDAADYDVIVVAMGGADLGERKIGRHWQHLGDPAYDVWMAQQIDGLADVLSEKGVPVLWATYPHMRTVDEERPDEQWTAYDDNDPHRVDRLNELIRSTVAGRDGFEVVDLTAWLFEIPRGEFNSDFRVGATFTEPGAKAAVAWLAPQVLSATG